MICHIYTLHIDGIVKEKATRINAART